MVFCNGQLLLIQLHPRSSWSSIYLHQCAAMLWKWNACIQPTSKICVRKTIALLVPVKVKVIFIEVNIVKWHVMRINISGQLFCFGICYNYVLISYTSATGTAAVWISSRSATHVHRVPVKTATSLSVCNSKSHNRPLQCLKLQMCNEATIV